MDGLTEGRIVHFVMNEGNFIGQHRPAIIVNAWGGNPESGRVNLCVFSDFGNDGKDFNNGPFWATSVPYSEGKEPFSWHWIEKA